MRVFFAVICTPSTPSQTLLGDGNRHDFRKSAQAPVIFARVSPSEHPGRRTAHASAHHSTALGLGLEGRPFPRQSATGPWTSRPAPHPNVSVVCVSSWGSNLPKWLRPTFSPGSSPSPARRSWLTSLSPGLTFLKFTSSARTKARARIADGGAPSPVLSAKTFVAPTTSQARGCSSPNHHPSRHRCPVSIYSSTARVVRVSRRSARRGRTGLTAAAAAAPSTRGETSPPARDIQRRRDERQGGQLLSSKVRRYVVVRGAALWIRSRVPFVQFQLFVQIRPLRESRPCRSGRGHH